MKLKNKLNEITEGLFLPFIKNTSIFLKAGIITGIVAGTNSILEQQGYSLPDYINNYYFPLQFGLLSLMTDYLSFPSNTKWKTQLKKIIPENNITTLPFSKKYFLQGSLFSIPVIGKLIYEQKEQFQQLITQPNMESGYSLGTLALTSYFLLKATYFAVQQIPFNAFSKKERVLTFLETIGLALSLNDKKITENHLKRIEQNTGVDSRNLFRNATEKNLEQLLDVYFQNIFLHHQPDVLGSELMHRKEYLQFKKTENNFDIFASLAYYSISEKQTLQEHYYNLLQQDSSLTLSQKVFVAWYAYNTRKKESITLWNDISQEAFSSKEFKEKIYTVASTEIKQLKHIIGTHALQSVLLFKEAPAKSKDFLEEYKLGILAEEFARNKEKYFSIPVFGYRNDGEKQSFSMIHPQAETVYVQLPNKNKKQLEELIIDLSELRTGLATTFTNQTEVNLQEIPLEQYIPFGSISKEKTRFYNYVLKRIYELTKGTWQPGLDFHTKNILEKYFFYGKIDHQNKGILPAILDHTNLVHYNFDRVPFAKIIHMMHISLEHYQQEFPTSQREIMTLQAYALIVRNERFKRAWSKNKHEDISKMYMFDEHVNKTINYLQPHIYSSERRTIQEFKRLFSM